MTAFLAVVALGGLIAFAIMGWRHSDPWVSRLARAGVALVVVGGLIEFISTGMGWMTLAPGWSFIIGTGLGFGVAVPGMILYAMPR